MYGEIPTEDHSGDVLKLLDEVTRLAAVEFGRRVPANANTSQIDFHASIHENATEAFACLAKARRLLNNYFLMTA